MQTSDGTPMTRRQYLTLVRDQERNQVRPEPGRTVPLALVPEARKPRRRAMLHSVPTPRRG